MTTQQSENSLSKIHATDAGNHVVSITMVDPVRNEHHIKNVVENAHSDWKSPGPHRPKPVHLIRQQSVVQSGADCDGVQSETISGSANRIEAPVISVYFTSNGSAFTKPGFNAFQRSGKFNFDYLL